MTDTPRLALIETLYDTNLLDVPAKLHELAEVIKSGRYGTNVVCCGVALLADKLYVFGYGPDSAFPSTAAVLQAAANTLIRDIEDHGKV